MISNRVAYLIAKKLSGEIAEIEISELNDALMANPGLHHIIQVLEYSWKNHDLPLRLEPSEIERITKKLEIAESLEIPIPLKLSEKDNDPKWIHYFTRNWGKVAAASIIIFVLGFWLLSGPRPGEKAKPTVEYPINEVTTKAGSKTRIVLPDGTIVWLNGDSKLTYINLFKGKTREVNLSGEAFFEVVSNKERPFIIHGQKITIKVTGTTFNVRDYPEEYKAETSLITGKVSVSLNKKPEEIYYLNPTEKIIFKEETTRDLVKKNFPEKIGNPQPTRVDITPLQIDEIDGIPVETAWVNNQLAFSNETFREVANKMEKWYGVTINFNSQIIEKQRLNGKFEKESLTEALEALQYTTPFRYEFADKKVLIYKK